jgi:hypothetical protein
MRAAAAFVATALVSYFIAVWALERLFPVKYVGDPADVDLQCVVAVIHSLKIVVFSVAFAIIGGSVAAWITTVPLERWHYNLRTLLAVITLVAVVLGLIVWATT